MVILSGIDAGLPRLEFKAMKGIMPHSLQRLYLDNYHEILAAYAIPPLIEIIMVNYTTYLNSCLNILSFLFACFVAAQKCKKVLRN